MSDIIARRKNQKKKKYYSLDAILKHDAQYYIILGGKGNGKSFAVKNKALEDAYKHDNAKFFYMRRYDKHATETNVYGYFRDADIKKITGGEYEGIFCYRRCIYFCNYDEKTGKAVKGKLAGYYGALNMYDAITSQSFLNVYNVLYEEFVTTGIYLRDECTELMKMVSTIARDDSINVFLIGNTVSRVNPYFQTWSLRGILKQKPGQIDDYYFEREDPTYGKMTTKIAVEMCEDVGTKSNMAFGSAAGMVAGAEWYTKEYPHPALDPITKRQKPFEIVYKFLLANMGLPMVVNYCIDRETGGGFIYVYPHNGKSKIQRVITDEFSPDPFVTNSLISNIPAEVKMHNLITLDKICFSDNLTGSDFEAVVQNMKGRL